MLNGSILFGWKMHRSAFFVSNRFPAESNEAVWHVTNALMFTRVEKVSQKERSKQLGFVWLCSKFSVTAKHP